MAVTNLAENNFYITFSKIEEKINNRIKGLDEKEQIRIKENMYKFYRNQISRLRSFYHDHHAIFGASVECPALHFLTFRRKSYRELRLSYRYQVAFEIQLSQNYLQK